MKDEGIDTVMEDLTNITTLEDAKSINSDDALLMSMGKKPELRRGKAVANISFTTVGSSGTLLLPL